MDQRTIAFLKAELEDHEHDLQYVRHPQTRKEIKQKIKLIKEALKAYGYIIPDNREECLVHDKYKH